MTRRSATARAARWSATHPWKAIGLWLLFIATTVTIAGFVSIEEATDDDMGNGPSLRATQMLDDAGLSDPATEHVLITSADGDGLDHSTVDSAMGDIADKMAALEPVDAVGDIIWSPSDDAAMLPITMRGDPDDAHERVAALREVTDEVAGANPDLRIEQTGSASMDDAMMTIVEEDLAKAETLSVPITMVLMLFAFGALIAAAIPVLLALSAVVSSFGLYALVSQLVPDSGTVANMILLIGMAVGVDYSLFFVKRQREERMQGRNSVDAVEVAAQTAGHSIVVSGFAVIVSVSALFFVGNVIFSGIAVGAVLVVVVAMLGSLTVVPALVGKLGRWVDRPRIPLLWRVLRRSQPGAISGRFVDAVLRRPKAALAASSIVMIALAAPALTMKLGDTGVEQLPDDVPAVAALNGLQSAFPSEGSELTVVVHAPAELGADVEAALGDLRTAAADTGDFAAEDDTIVVSDDGETYELQLHSVHSEGSSAAIDALHEVRDDLAPAALSALAGIDGVEWATGGSDADSVDFADQQSDALPLVVGFVLVFTLLMMGITFRSVGIALITIVLNLASVVAAFGILTVVFQNTWAEALLDFTSNGTVVSWIPLFMFVVLIGLSMDYHVLVLSRIREAAQHGATPLQAISSGLRHTAGPVSMAAIVMVSVFGLFAVGTMPDMKQMGVGLAAAVLIDATLVRVVMLPAVLALCNGVVETMGRRARRRDGTSGWRQPTPDVKVPTSVLLGNLDERDHREESDRGRGDRGGSPVGSVRRR